MVPLSPQAGDCYILTTHPLREGELSLLARDLGQARDLGTLLRIATSGEPGSGRVAIAALAGEHETAVPVVPADEEEPAEYGPLELDPIEPAGRAETETMHPEDLKEIIVAYRRKCSTEITRYGGDVARRTGSAAR